MKTGDIIRQLRERKGWTHLVIAKQIGIHQSTISGWEIGKAFPNDACLEALAGIFHCDFEELQGDDYNERRWQTRKELSKKTLKTRQVKTMLNGVDITNTQGVANLMQEAGEKLNTAASELEASAKELDEQAEKIEKLRQRIKYLDGIIEDKDAKIDELRNELKEVNEKLDEARVEPQRLPDEERVMLEAQIKMLNRDNARMRDALAKLMIREI